MGWHLDRNCHRSGQRRFDRRGNRIVFTYDISKSQGQGRDRCCFGARQSKSGGHRSRKVNLRPERRKRTRPLEWRRQRRRGVPRGWGFQDRGLACGEVLSSRRSVADAQSASRRRAAATRRWQFSMPPTRYSFRVCSTAIPRAPLFASFVTTLISSRPVLRSQKSPRSRRILIIGAKLKGRGSIPVSRSRVPNQATWLVHAGSHSARRRLRPSGSRSWR